MSSLAVRVVRHDIEERNSAHFRLVVFAQGEEGSLGIVGNVELNRPRAMRSIANNGRRDEAPTEVDGEKICGALSSKQRPVGKIPQRRLSTLWFVNGKSAPFLT